MTNKNCSSCGTDFVCCANHTDTPCWCADLPAVMPIDISRDCQCPDCLKSSIMERIQQTMQDIQLEEKLAIAAAYADQNTLIEDMDFTIENGKYVFSAWYHLKRGSCCGSGCRNCPYDPIIPG